MRHVQWRHFELQFKKYVEIQSEIKTICNGFSEELTTVEHHKKGKE